ncbi:MAG: tetratricopeptide repeat protein [Armatimonadota bacterium]
MPTASANDLLAEGLNALKSNRLDDAINAISQALQQQPRNAKARELLGIAYSQKGMFQEAVEEFRRAISIAPTSASIHFNLGMTYEKMGRSDLAKGEYYQTVQCDPKHVRARHRLEALGAAPPTSASDESSLKRIACPKCRTLNTEGELTCFACGHPLVSKPPTVAPGAPRPSGATAQAVRTAAQTSAGFEFPWGMLVGFVVLAAVALLGYFIVWPKIAGG